MNALWCAFFVALIVLMPMPSLNFSDSSTNVVNCGSGTDFDNMATGTIIAWVKPGTFAANQSIATKFVSANAAFSFAESDGSGNLVFIIQRATTDLNATSNTAPLSVGSWSFVAATWDINGSNSSQKIFTGTLTASAAEVSYSTQTIGSGTRGDDAAGNFAIGNISPGSSNIAFSGDIYCVGVYNAALTLEQIKSLQFYPRKLDSCIGIWFLGTNGVGTQTDYSGNANNGTVTGATQSNNAPLLFRF